jgi:hypothetical protein
MLIDGMGVIKIEDCILHGNVQSVFLGSYFVSPQLDLNALHRTRDYRRPCDGTEYMLRDLASNRQSAHSSTPSSPSTMQTPSALSRA